jgi:hypothetical protein
MVPANLWKRLSASYQAEANRKAFVCNALIRTSTSIAAELEVAYFFTSPNSMLDSPEYLW